MKNRLLMRPEEGEEYNTSIDNETQLEPETPEIVDDAPLPEEKKSGDLTPDRMREELSRRDDLRKMIEERRKINEQLDEKLDKFENRERPSYGLQEGIAAASKSFNNVIGNSSPGADYAIKNYQQMDKKFDSDTKSMRDIINERRNRADRPLSEIKQRVELGRLQKDEANIPYQEQAEQTGFASQTASNVNNQLQETIKRNSLSTDNVYNNFTLANDRAFLQSVVDSNGQNATRAKEILDSGTLEQLNTVERQTVLSKILNPEQKEKYKLFQTGQNAEFTKTYRLNEGTGDVELIDSTKNRDTSDTKADPAEKLRKEYRNETEVYRKQLDLLNDAGQMIDDIKNNRYDARTIGSLRTKLASSIQAGVLTESDFLRGSNNSPEIVTKIQEIISGKLTGKVPPGVVAALGRIISDQRNNTIKAISRSDKTYTDLAKGAGFDPKTVVTRPQQLGYETKTNEQPQQQQQSNKSPQGDIMLNSADELPDLE
jgi:hypothetical protein